LKFRQYIPKGSKGLPVKYYCTDPESLTITKRSVGYTIESTDQTAKNSLLSIFLSHGITLSDTPEKFHLAMSENGLIQSKKSYGKMSYSSSKTGFSSGQSDIDTPKTTGELIAESSTLRVSKVPMRPNTLENITIYVSSNEPVEMYKLFAASTVANVERVALSVGDVMAIHEKTGDTIYFERKSTRDLKNSILTTHAHDQSERMYEAVRDIQEVGKQARAFWLIEAIDGGEVLVDASLPELVQMVGVRCYFDVIQEQSIVQTWSMNHSVYTALKYMQGFFERKLFYSAKTQNPKINKSKRDRLLTMPVNEVDSGVIRHTSDDLVHMLNYIPGVNLKVAKELASLGKSFSEITSMSFSELLDINGVGEKSAKLIFNVFNKRNV
jgi:ERCC4-type nuclease